MADFAQYALAESDIQFLKKKQDEGNLIIQTGTLSTTGELVSYTPATGKKFYLARAKSVADITAVDGNVIAELQNNGVVKDYFIERARSSLGFQERGLTHTPSGSYSIIQGDSLVGDGIKKYRINITSLTSATAFGILLGWIEDA